MTDIRKKNLLKNRIGQHYINYNTLNGDKSYDD